MFRAEDEFYILNIISLGISMGVVYRSVELTPRRASTSGEDGAGTSKDGEPMDLVEEKRMLGKKLKKLNEDLIRVRQAFSRDKQVGDKFVGLFTELQSEAQHLQRIYKNMRAANAQSDDALLRQLIATIDQIYAISSELGIRFEKQGHVRVDSASSLIDYLVKQPAYKQYNPSEIKELFEGCFKELDDESRRRLFCFSVFPEGSIVRKQVLMHWWIGENLLGSKDPEFDADEMLSFYCESGFIKPAMGEGKVVGFKMDPVIRYVVIYLAERKGFMDFDFSWRPTGNFSYSKRACLVNTEEAGSKEGGTKEAAGTEEAVGTAERGTEEAAGTQEGGSKEGAGSKEGSNSQQLMKFDNPKKLLALFYVSGGSHALTPQWFSSIRNVEIICLGRWELEGKEEDIRTFQRRDDKVSRLRNSKSLTDGIKFLPGLKHLKVKEEDQKELEGKEEDIQTGQRRDDKMRGPRSTESSTFGPSIKFLQGLQYLKNLKFLSLEGFRTMSELPVAAGKLQKLIVLNLKDCDLLGTLPNDIGSLKDLTHLDISGCQGLKFMPKGLNQLTALQVLKGFVTGDRYEGSSVCKLDDLVELKKLKKLSVIISKRKPEHLLALKGFPSLKILRISWVDGIKGLDSSVQWLPPGLEKLDLRGIPTDKIHIRVMPEKLKKLYIIDANLSHLYLGPGDLRILRLQNLRKFRMDLTDIIDQFRQLIYCKVVGCIKIEPFVDRMMEEMEFQKLDESSPAAWVNTKLNYETLKQDLGFKWSFLRSK